MEKTENNVESKSLNLSKMNLIDLKRRLTKEEYAKVQKAYENFVKELEREFPEDISGTLLFKMSVLDKRAINSQASRLINAAANLDIIHNAQLSLKLIEANKEIATEIAEDREKVKNAINTISSAISRRFRLKSKLFSRKNKKSE